MRLSSRTPTFFNLLRAAFLLLVPAACNMSTHPAPSAASANFPAWSEFENLLDKPIDSPAVRDFCERYQLTRYWKFDSGGFENYSHQPFTLLYNNNRIDRVIVVINHQTDTPFPEVPLYRASLPGGVRPDDSQADVARRLGTPAQNSRDGLSYRTPPLSFTFDQTTHKLVEIDLDAHAATASTAPASRLFTTRSIGDELLNQKVPLDLSEAAALALFDKTPTHLRPDWQDHLPANIQGVPNGPANTGQSNPLLVPPRSTEPRAEVAYFSTNHLFISIYRPAGDYLWHHYQDEIASIMVDRTPALDALFNLPELTKTYATTYHGLQQGDPLTYVTQDLGAPEKTESTQAVNYYTMIYNHGNVRITIWNNSIHTITIGGN